MSLIHRQREAQKTLQWNQIPFAGAAMKFIRRAFVFGVIGSAMIGMWLYQRDLAISESYEFLPESPVFKWLPAGTRIEAVLRYGIIESTEVGDKIVAFVAEPVRVNNEIAVPVGAQLNGTVDAISADEQKATVRLTFYQVVVDKKSSAIRTGPVTETVPVVSDLTVIAQAFEATTGAAFGAALGAAAGDVRQTAVGTVLGTIAGLPSVDALVPIKVVLSEPVELQT
jgi:hypothetical protein